jgi:hypothetical protein
MTQGGAVEGKYPGRRTLLTPPGAAPAGGAARRIIVNPTTNERMELVNGQWVPLK